jgi:hypothetical protein
MIDAQCGSIDPFSGLAGQNNKLLDNYLNRLLLKISPDWRNCLSPKYIPLTAAEFINNYEEAFPDGVAGNCFIPDDVLGKYSDIYGKLKYYINVLSCYKKSDKNFIARCEFMSQLGYSETMLKKFYDPILKRYKLFEALNYFVFEELALNETETLILRHHLNYSNEYVFVNGDELPGRPDIEKGYLHHTAEVIRMEIAKYIFNFTAFQPWIDYGKELNLTADFIILTPSYLEYIRAEKKVEYLTLPFLAAVLAVIYNYTNFIIEFDEQNNYNLIKGKLLQACGIPSNVRKININTTNEGKEPANWALLKRLFKMIYKSRNDSRFSLN